ncbi:Uncharacterised protein [Legionella wadsworthii]|uniref:Uncharacterized protein n=1 Tax=Legionella wadsworthii TaxID=28088 RepID=A0A378LVK2_9GAMM|nr:hypothetical protein [Legionella wadsworthii]STY31723.1 Uncharacterised protein [Legionella wadsworthii]
MPVVAIELEEEEKKQKLLQLYRQVMSTEAKAFKSLKDLQDSDIWSDLSEKEQELLGQYEGKNVTILIFDDADKALEFINQAKKEGLFSEEQAEALINQINEQNQSYAHRM